jgi:hypothetical protein
MQTTQASVSRRQHACAGIAFAAAAALTTIFILANAVVSLRAQASGLAMTVPNLAVRTAVADSSLQSDLCFSPIRSGS